MQVGGIDQHVTIGVFGCRNLPGVDRAQNGVFVAANGRSGCCKVVHGVPDYPFPMPYRVSLRPLIKGDRVLIARARRSAANPKTLARNNKTGSIELV